MKLTWEQFENQYKPTKNKVTKREEFNGWLYETYGDDLEQIVAYANKYPNLVWTILDCDGATVISNGYHLVNRMGYIITRKPFKDGDDIEVIDSDDEERYLKPIVVKKDGNIAFAAHGWDGIMAELEEAGLIEECYYSSDDMPQWMADNGYTWEFVESLPNEG